MMSFWVMLDDSINTDELLAGAGAAALAAFFAELVTYQAATRFRMRIEWLVPVFSLPGQVICFRERHVKRLLAFSAVATPACSWPASPCSRRSAWPASPST